MTLQRGFDREVTSLTLVNLGTLTRTGGAVNLAGTLDHTRSTFTLNSVTGSWNLIGRILNGTLVETAGVALNVSNGNAAGSCATGCASVSFQSLGGRPVLSKRLHVLSRDCINTSFTMLSKSRQIRM